MSNSNSSALSGSGCDVGSQWVTEAFKASWCQWSICHPVEWGVNCTLEAWACVLITTQLTHLIPSQTLHPYTHSIWERVSENVSVWCWSDFCLVLLFWQVWSSLCQGRDFIATCVACFTAANKQPRRHTVGVQFTTGTYRSWILTCSLPFSFH